MFRFNRIPVYPFATSYNVEQNKAISVDELDCDQLQGDSLTTLVVIFTYAW